MEAQVNDDRNESDSAMDTRATTPSVAQAPLKDAASAPPGPPTAADLFNRQVDLQKIEFLNERMQLLQQENEALRERHEKREQETHEFVAYFQKEIQTRDKQLTKLTEELAALKLSHALEMESYMQAKESECQQLQSHYSTKEEKFTEQLFYLKEELTQLEMFREMKETYQQKMKTLDANLQKEKDQNKDLVGALERKFLEEKARLQKEHEKKIEIVKQQAKEDARNGLDADTRKIVTDNRRMGEELRFQLQITEELQKEKDYFEAKAKKYYMEMQICKSKEEEYAQRAQKQSREIKQLRQHVKSLEKQMSESIAELEREKFVEVNKNGKQMDDMALDVEGLRKLVRLKNKELRNLRTLSQTILEQRTQVEQFFLDALEHVKIEIAIERKRKKQEEMEKYQLALKKANAQAMKGKVRFPQITSTSLLGPSEEPTKSEDDPVPVKHFSEKVDLRDLTWEDRERVLRLVFAKINGMSSYADVREHPSAALTASASTASMAHSPPSTNQGPTVYFATEPAPLSPATASSTHSLSLSGMAMTPFPPPTKQRHS